MRIRIFDTPHDAGIYAASITEQVVLNSPSPVLGLATGSTTIPYYDALVNLERCGLDLSRTVTVNLDEYIGLSHDHHQSYHHFMTQHLFSRLRVPPKESYLPNGMVSDLQLECQQYDSILAKHPIDLQILGIGTNGHIGFNEPDGLLISNTHVVDLSRQTIQSNSRFFASSSDVPRRAITMGVQAILQAQSIILMAFGPEKADIIAQTVHGQVRTDVPASILNLHRDVTVVLDVASAGKIELPQTPPRGADTSPKHMAR